MREILFRAKAIENKNNINSIINKGDWVYGYYCPKPYSSFPCEPSIYPVDTINQCYAAIRIDIDTLGQYTGLTDKNGNRIFEGDVIITIDTGYDRFLVGEVRTTFGFDFRYILDTKDDAYVTALDIGDIGISADDKYLTSAEVIGNIHDNPELLEMV